VFSLFIGLNTKNNNLYYIIILNLAMLFISTSGPLGRYISLPPPITIWFRSLIAILCLISYALLKKTSFKINLNNHGLALFLSGLFISLHWITYFFALQWSNVTVGMLSLFTYPIITVLLEPLFMPTKLKARHIIFGILILIGVFFLIPNFDFNNKATQGLLMGLFSALAYSLRNLILKKHNSMADGSIQMIYQLFIVIILLLPVFFIYSDYQIQSDLPYLLVLGFITTALGHTLFLSSFSHFSISTASIISSIQPLFGIIMGIILLNEIPNFKNVIGGIIILSTVVIESIKSKEKDS
tara:strand:- start:7867 stop:8760 length:894 start_codon:yes stop_codon:yes gene_type:complete